MADVLSSRQRLNRLLDLAAQGPAARAALLDDLTDLLLDWPIDYAQAMRAPFEALLEKTAREADAEARRRLLARIANRPEIPIALCNAFFLDADIDTRRAILARNAADCEETAAYAAHDGAALVHAARTTVNGTFVKAFASSLALPPELASRIMSDGHALAVAAKGTGLDRAAYSAIALISGSELVDFETIPSAGAKLLTLFWRERR